MRQSVAMLVARCALVALSLALGAHVAAHTVFDPDRPARVVAAVLETDAGRDTVAGAMSAAVTATVPGADRDVVSAATRSALESPETRRLLVDAAGTRDGVVVPSGQLTAVVADALVGTHPDLAAKVAATPVADVPMPAGLGARVDAGYRRAVAVSRLAGCAAATFAGVAVVVAARRHVVLRRMGRGCLVASAGAVALFVVAPSLLTKASGEHGGWLEAVAVALNVAGADLVPPLVVVAGIGAVLLTVARARSVVGGRAAATSPGRPGQAAARSSATSSPYGASSGKNTSLTGPRTGSPTGR